MPLEMVAGRNVVVFFVTRLVKNQPQLEMSGRVARIVGERLAEGENCTVNVLAGQVAFPTHKISVVLHSGTAPGRWFTTNRKGR